MQKCIEKQIKDRVTDNFLATPDPDNIFVWYFLVFGLKDTFYEGGYYMGKLVFPQDYPWKPPSIIMITKNGRFALNQKICLSISDFHPETWNPIWPISSILIGLISFMVTKDSTVGSINTTEDEIKRIARESE